MAAAEADQHAVDHLLGGASGSAGGVEDDGDPDALRRRVLGERRDQAAARLLEAAGLQRCAQRGPRVHGVVAVDYERAHDDIIAPRSRAAAPLRRGEPLPPPPR